MGGLRGRRRSTGGSSRRARVRRRRARRASGRCARSTRSSSSAMPSTSSSSMTPIASCERGRPGWGLKLYGDLQIGFSLEDAWAWQGAVPAHVPDGRSAQPHQPRGPAVELPRAGSRPVLRAARGPAAGAPARPRAALHGRADGQDARRVRRAAHRPSARVGVPLGLPRRTRRTRCARCRRARGSSTRRTCRTTRSWPGTPSPPPSSSTARCRATRMAGCARSPPSRCASTASCSTPSSPPRAATGAQLTDLLAEVLSTQPYPLQRVLAQYGLGRFRVTQKANLQDTRRTCTAARTRPRRTG